jgi:hypothetical protein
MRVDMTAKKTKSPSPEKGSELAPVADWLIPGTDHFKQTGQVVYVAGDLSGGLTRLHELAHEDGTLMFMSPRLRLAVMDLGEGWRQGRDSARRLLEVLADDSDFPTIDEHLKSHPVDAHTLIQLLWLVRKQGVARNTKKAAQAASAKSAEAREWVRLQWEHRKDKSITKKAFAGSMVQAVSEEYGLTVSARQILDRWLVGLL